MSTNKHIPLIFMAMICSTCVFILLTQLLREVYITEISLQYRICHLCSLSSMLLMLIVSPPSVDLLSFLRCQLPLDYSLPEQSPSSEICSTTAQFFKIKQKVVVKSKNYLPQTITCKNKEISAEINSHILYIWV